MIKRLFELIESERQLPMAIRLRLVDGLFYPFASLIAGALCGLFIAATATLTQTDPYVVTASVMVLIVALLRIAIGLRYILRRQPVTEQNVDFWERAYGIGAALFSAALGMAAFFAVQRTQSEPLHLMMATTAAAYAASITGRNAGRPMIALAQLYLAAGPMCAGLIFHPELFYQAVGGALCLFMFGMTDITVSVRKTLLGAIETERANAELARSFKSQALLFDAALNNMTHGLCMFDQHGQLLVWNKQFVAIAECEGEALLAGMSIDDVLGALSNGRLAVRNGPLVDCIRLSLRTTRQRQNFVRLGDEKVIAVSRQRMDNGNVVMVLEDVTEQAKAQQRIEHLARVDELTGLMNRSAFQQDMADRLDKVPPGWTGALLMVDLDQFKMVNDTLGHPTGDRLLKAVAQRISAIVGRRGHVGRLGGDEFVILLDAVENQSAFEVIAKAIIDVLGEPFAIEGQSLNIGASIGIALIPHHGQDHDILLKRADMALYRAKAMGRMTYFIFEDTLDLLAQQRRELELDLRAALENEQFTVAFQPIVNTVSGKVDCVETLIRWNHPTRGEVPPADFIGLAEEIGLISEIGRWVLRAACQQARHLPQDMAIAVNFSAEQFRDRSFPDYLAHILETTGLPAHRLELEITETALLDDNIDAQPLLDAFQGMGIRVSLDDFGTGYSSLSHLRTFPFSKIKIDGSFIADVCEDSSAVAVVHATIDIGRKLDMAIVAEGVETPQQLDFIIEAGCTHAQGYLLGRPMSAREIRSHIGRRGAIKRRFSAA